MARNFILTDQNVADLLPDLIARYHSEYQAEVIIVAPGEQSKSLETLADIWQRLSQGGASRASILICIGGGMITDLGGFAAACFKRGIPHINVSTTLLGAVDAAIGGKTGIDFLGLKNELGAFKMPLKTLADVNAFASLPPEEILSGWGEAVKTALIADDDMTDRMLNINPLQFVANDMEAVVDFCRNVKNRVVADDPTEKGLRKILNFGHTAGHAIESLLLSRHSPVPHGILVAHGILISLILSHNILNLDKNLVSRYAAWLREYYPKPNISCRDFETIADNARHDKKNSDNNTLSFVLLEAPGRPLYDIPVSRQQLLDALDLYATMI